MKFKWHNISKYSEVILPLLRHKFNRFLSYYILDFSPKERLNLWSKLLLNELINSPCQKKVKLKEFDIDSFYVISLNHRHDRRIKIKKMLDIHEIKFQFFDGTTTKQLFEVKDLFTRWSFASLTSGSKCCAASHISLWKKISMNPNESLNVIFEDDIILKENIDISSFKDLLPDDLDILYFGSWNNRGRDINYSVSKTIFSSFNPRKGLYAYAITPTGARKLIEKTLPLDIIYGGLDTKIGKIVRQGKIKAYQKIPNIISIDYSFPSDIFNPSLPNKRLYSDTIK